jgi:penicillin-binding protein 1A
VAKSLLVSHESYEQATARKLRRKIREAILALRLERALSKEEILYLYVNQIYLGHKAYGVQAAAEHYYRKNVWELSLAETATLAGLPQRPSDYSPFARPGAALARRRYVLRRMLEDEYITQAEHDAAADAKVSVFPRDEPYLSIAPYYTEQVRREIIERYGERGLLEDGLEVYTALNLQLQSFGRKAIDDGLHALDKRQGYRGPLAHLKNRKKRDLFRSRYRAKLGLAEGKELDIEDGVTYIAVVTALDASGKFAELDIAGHPGILPLAGMRWARRPNPIERVDFHYLHDVRQRLRVGDVVAVTHTTRAGLARDRHGWEIWTTAPKEGDLFKLEQEPSAQAALLSVDPRSGYVVAQIGGYDFDESTYNRAVQACREPGSAFKPVVYSAAIDKLDYTASTLVDDKPLVFDDPDNVMRWKPGNAGEEFRGRLPVRTCLKDSINIPAIRVANEVGIEDLIKNARRLGITTPIKRELGTAIGSSCTTLYDLIQAYITINQYGVRQDPVFITRVVDRYGNVLENHAAPWDPLLDFGSRMDAAYRKLVAPNRRALDPQTAFLMISLLKNVVTSGTGIAASRTGHVVAGKTGTTNDAFDAWFMGMTTKLVTGVWVGHDKKERPLGVSEQGGRTALPIWLAYTVPALQDYTVKPPRRKAQGDFAPPGGVVRVSIDPETGLLARPGSARAVWEYYRTGTEPTSYTPDKSVFDPKEHDPFMLEPM